LAFGRSKFSSILAIIYHFKKSTDAERHCIRSISNLKKVQTLETGQPLKLGWRYLVFGAAPEEMDLPAATSGIS